jgi:hypothetical protein
VAARPKKFDYSALDILGHFLEKHLPFPGFRLYYRFIAFLKDFAILES